MQLGVESSQLITEGPTHPFLPRLTPWMWPFNKPLFLVIINLKKATVLHTSTYTHGRTYTHVRTYRTIRAFPSWSPYCILTSSNSFSVDLLGYYNRRITVSINNANFVSFLINLKKKNLTALASLSENNVLYGHHCFFPDLWRNVFSFLLSMVCVWLSDHFIYYLKKESIHSY